MAPKRTPKEKGKAKAEVKRGRVDSELKIPTTLQGHDFSTEPGPSINTPIDHTVLPIISSGAPFALPEEVHNLIGAKRERNSSNEDNSLDSIFSGSPEKEVEFLTNRASKRHRRCSSETFADLYAAVIAEQLVEDPVPPTEFDKRERKVSDKRVTFAPNENGYGPSTSKAGEMVASRLQGRPHSQSTPLLGTTPSESRQSKRKRVVTSIDDATLTKDDKTKELALVDDKKAKRILANRLSAQRSRQKKLQFIARLNAGVEQLQEEINTDIKKVHKMKSIYENLAIENKKLKEELETYYTLPDTIVVGKGQKLKTPPPSPTSPRSKRPSPIKEKEEAKEMGGSTDVDEEGAV